MLDLYQKRWEIETLSAALKSRGFELEEAHITKPDRIQKLLGILALTYSPARIIGIGRKAKGGAPRERANGYQESSSGTSLDHLRELAANWLECDANCTGALKHSSLLTHFCRVARSGPTEKGS
jgi:hypothetical protein